MPHGYREITGKSKHSLFKTQLLKWVFGTGTGASVDSGREILPMGGQLISPLAVMESPH